MTRRVRSVVRRNPEVPDAKCPALEESLKCNAVPCAFDCTVDPFMAWSDCTHTCKEVYFRAGERVGSHEGGSQARTRRLVQAAFGGKACPHSAETRACGRGDCPVKPTCHVDAHGRTNVHFTRALHPSFKCHHKGSECHCIFTHPTHHKGGCREFDHTDGVKFHIAGDCGKEGADAPEVLPPTPSPTPVGCPAGKFKLRPYLSECTLCAEIGRASCRERV